jgi:hypothetical protein
MTKVACAIRHAHRLGYRVLENGDVRSPAGKARKTPLTCIGRILYPRWTVKFRGASVSIPVHRFAGFQLFGERALRKGVMVRHRDGNSMNRCLSNFCLGNNSSNMLDLGREHLATIGRRGAHRLNRLLRSRTPPERAAARRRAEDEFDDDG